MKTSLSFAILTIAAVSAAAVSTTRATAAPAPNNWAAPGANNWAALAASSWAAPYGANVEELPMGMSPAGFAPNYDPLMAGPPPVGPAACPPKITYVHHGMVPPCDRCLPPIETVLEVKVPCGCDFTTVLIPVCLPACCTDVPQVTCHGGLLGRGIVRYDYCCGVSVKIVIRRAGDFVVHYIHA